MRVNTRRGRWKSSGLWGLLFHKAQKREMGHTNSSSNMINCKPKDPFNFFGAFPQRSFGDMDHDIYPPNCSRKDVLIMTWPSAILGLCVISSA